MQERTPQYVPVYHHFSSMEQTRLHWQEVPGNGVLLQVAD
jgi:hypothetical protein